MITKEQAQVLLDTYFNLKNQFESEPNSKNKMQLERHRNYCMKQLEYLVTTKLYKYAQFPNYEDLYQDGMEALNKAITTYDPSTNALFFWWAHKYIGIKISRSANLHSTIRYPLKKAKAIQPKRQEWNSNVLYKYNLVNEEVPDKILEKQQIDNIVNNSINNLSDIQRQILAYAYGLGECDPHNLSLISDKLNISKNLVTKELLKALRSLKQNCRNQVDSRGK